MVDNGAQVSLILAGLVASTRLFKVEGASLSAPQFCVHLFMGASMAMLLLMLCVRLGRQGDAIWYFTV